MCQRAVSDNETWLHRSKRLHAAASAACCLRPACPPLQAVRMVARGPILVRQLLRRGSFYSGGGAMCAKGLRRQLKRAVGTTVNV